MAIHTMESFTFHTNSSAAGNGNVYSNNGINNTMQLQFIVSESGTFSASLEIMLEDQTHWYAYPSFKLPTYDLISGAITDATCLYEVDLPCATKVRVRLTAISGSVTVYGRVVG